MTDNPDDPDDGDRDDFVRSIYKHIAGLAEEHGHPVPPPCGATLAGIGLCAEVAMALVQMGAVHQPNEHHFWGNILALVIEEETRPKGKPQ